MIVRPDPLGGPTERNWPSIRRAHGCLKAFERHYLDFGILTGEHQTIECQCTCNFSIGG